MPFSHVDDVGLRKITKNTEITRVLDFLAYGKCHLSDAWKTRSKENFEKMRSGSLFAIAEVLKTLLLLQLEKSLTFPERKTLDRARYMLITEISISRSICEEANSMLQKVLAKASLNLPSPR